jgi:DNA mismatch repair protein MutS
VAKLAGLPAEVITSARQVLQRMEREAVRAGSGAQERAPEPLVEKEIVVQEHPVLEELKTINIEQISPIEALNLLHEVQKKLCGSL